MIFFFYLRVRRPPGSTRTDTLFPYTTLFRSDPKALQDATFTLKGNGKPEDIAKPTGTPLPTAKVITLPAGLTGGTWSLTVGSATASGLAHNARSEEHTSELQSLMRISYAVFCLKKKNETTTRENDEDKK